MNRVVSDGSTVPSGRSSDGEFPRGSAGAVGPFSPSALDGNPVLEFRYDPFGRQSLQTLDLPVVRTNYMYDRADLRPRQP